MGKSILSAKKLLKISLYHQTFLKRFLDLIISTLTLIILSPLILAVAGLIRVVSGKPVFFFQKRVGKDGKVFNFIKFRTMMVNAEKEKSKYRKLNEADGPVFKIQNDPRFTKVGRILSKSSLDEIPQFINVLKGEMSIVGPRPLPIYEANKLTSRQKIRNLVKPGMTSPWVINGAHKLPFKKWMELDRKYVMNASLGGDVVILIKTFLTIMKHILNSLPRLIGF